MNHQWRRDLKLSGEAAVEKLTLDGVRGLRVMLSATAHDILYYMSPIYCQAIIDSVLTFIILSFSPHALLIMLYFSCLEYLCAFETSYECE